MGVIYIFLSRVFALFFYGLRRRRPFAYGLSECAVGLIGLTLTFLSPNRFPPSSGAEFLGNGPFSRRHDSGGIYLLVRGMDNMDRDLPNGWRHHWEILFPKRNT